jgi:hypothetical protein
MAAVAVEIVAVALAVVEDLHTLGVLMEEPLRQVYVPDMVKSLLHGQVLVVLLLLLLLQ